MLKEPGSDERHRPLHLGKLESVPQSHKPHEDFFFFTVDWLSTKYKISGSWSEECFFTDSLCSGGLIITQM